MLGDTFVFSDGSGDDDKSESIFGSSTSVEVLDRFPLPNTHETRMCK